MLVVGLQTKMQNNSLVSQHLDHTNDEDAGASHIIVTSHVFDQGQIDFQRLEALVALVGKDRLVLDLRFKPPHSCLSHSCSAVKRRMVHFLLLPTVGLNGQILKLINKT